MSRPRLSVRELTPSDLPMAVELLRLRDGRHHEADAVGRVLFGLEPEWLRAWGAFVDDEPVGMTTFYVRPLSGWAADEVLAGYWAHLYVRPEFRRLMVYPLLVRAMRQGVREAGCELIYTATRRPRVAEGHQKLGFELVGKLPVDFKPLRPFRLLAKQKRLGRAVERAAVLGDAPWGALSGLGGARRRGVAEHHDVAPSSAEVATIVELMNRTRRGRISQIWSPDSFQRRFGTTIDGSGYRLVATSVEGELAGALVFCVARRGEDVRAGVLIEAVSRRGRETVLQSLVGEAERRMMKAGCEVVLRLGGPAARMGESELGRGYRKAPHLYHVLVWSPDETWKSDARAELDSWYFAFSDHDAF